MGIRALIARQRITVRLQEVSSDDAEEHIMAACSDELVDELYEFGGRLMDEALDRTAQLDGKATTLLGWGSASVAFLLVGIDRTQTPDAIDALIAVAVILALSGSIYAGLALRIIDWEFPSEKDWFKFKLFSDPQKLRIYHLLGMLETHQFHNRQNRLKGERVRRAQWFVICATVLVGAIVLLR
jgi:hypothetical protein